MQINALIARGSSPGQDPFTAISSGREAYQNRLLREAEQPFRNALLGQQVQRGSMEIESAERTNRDRQFYDALSTALATGNPSIVRRVIGAAPNLLEGIDDETRQEFGILSTLDDQSIMQAAPKVQEVFARRAGIASSGMIPADFRSFDMMTQGMSPEDREKARRINLGLEPRAGGGGMKFDMIRGRDGIERPARQNPASGAVEVFDGSKWVELGAEGQAAMMGVQSVLGQSRTPEEQAALTTVATEEAKLGVERAANQPKAESAAAGVSARISLLDDLINKARGQSSGWTTGFVGNVLGKVPGTPAYDLSQTLDAIRANIGFQELQAMRDSSPTGGALGQVTERELAFLQATLGSLEQSQSQKQFEENLERVRKQVRQSWERVAKAYRETYGRDLPADLSPASPANDIDELLRKYGGQ